ncbi:hypothetical protein C8Q76DRAFT_792235 [Earliella scabrosa]|nr:hypothetical protein C8Q76DRAFT_792235 [Earliella scabrosa]
MAASWYSALKVFLHPKMLWRRHPGFPQVRMPLRQGKSLKDEPVWDESRSRDLVQALSDPIITQARGLLLLQLSDVQMAAITTLDAAVQVRKKDSELRAAASEFDSALNKLRITYLLEADPSTWSASVAATLELENKDRRFELRRSTRRLSLKLYNLYHDDPGSACDGGEQNETINEWALILQEMIGFDSDKTSGAKRGSKNKASKYDQVDLMPNLMERVEVALTLCASVEDLQVRVETIHSARLASGGLPPRCRALLHRALPRNRKELQQIVQYKRLIQEIMNEWSPYFAALVTKSHREQILDAIQAGKIPKSRFLQEAAPLCARLAELQHIRDAAVNEGTRLTFQKETTWLAISGCSVPSSLLDEDLLAYHELITAVTALRPQIDSVTGQFDELQSLAKSPAVVRGPHGVDIYLDRFVDAYEEYHKLQGILNSTLKLGKMLMERLQDNLATLSEA